MYTGFATEATEKMVQRALEFIGETPKFTGASGEQRIELLRIYMDSAVRLITKEA